MTSSFDTLQHLMCPFCTGRLTRGSVLTESEGGEIDFGILDCKGCGFEYPVVAGVPILMAADEAIDSRFGTTQVALLDGPCVADVVGMLKKGEPLAALASLLNPSQLGGDWFPALDLPNGRAQAESDHAGARRLGRAARRAKRVASRRLGRFVLPRARLRLAEFLRKHHTELSALDVIDLYYRRYSGSEGFSYFGYRFGQPRLLAALTLLVPLLDTTGPLLDLACGAGHLTHFLCASQPSRPVFGVDHDFFRLWLAKHFIAPRAAYICASADHPLPFPNGTFGGIICSDAFHYFLHRAAAVRELERLAGEEGVVVLARIGNVGVEPREGYELHPDGYARLFQKSRHVLVAESELIAAYKARVGPDLSLSRSSGDLKHEKWLSVVASKRAEVFGPAKPLQNWLHAAGRLQLNPIYKISTRHGNGDLDLRFEFPTNWYKFENQGYLEYAPKECRVPGAVLEALATGRDHPALESLISQFVVIGMPDRYSSAPAA